MTANVVIAADGGEWEATLLTAVEVTDLGVSVVRRCMDVVELVSVALTGQASVALVWHRLRGLDRDIVDQLLATGVTPVAVTHSHEADVVASIRAKGIRHVVAMDADPGVIATALLEATTAADGLVESRSFSLPGPGPIVAAHEVDQPSVARASSGRIVAVWGPAGAPGRTTVAVALSDEIARLQVDVLLVDADVYGGTIATRMGILDESPGLAAACRPGSAVLSDPAALADLAWQLGPRLRVLTGIPLAQRWPEIRPSTLESVLSMCRGAADWTVVDVGFSVEADEELSFDSIAPRRNGATLAVLDAADVIIVVGDCDPVGLQRLAYALLELEESGRADAVHVVLNKVRPGFGPGDAAAHAADTLERIAGRAPAACLPYDRDALDACLAGGRALADVRPRSRLRQAVAMLAQTLTGLEARARSSRHARK